MKAVFYWFTNNIGIGKSIFTMLLVATIVWGGSIWYTEANTDRLLMGDFKRIEVWLAIVGGLLGMGTGLFLMRRDKIKRRELKQQKILKNS